MSSLIPPKYLATAPAATVAAPKTQPKPNARRFAVGRTTTQ